ncbi:MAG TPA: flagellar basal body rod protein FlgB [Syntrophobacteraceae bacterium]|nr:flagellar basal body rod protein FlgB [Syntrophobacteraceae bacterium]
MDHSVVFGRTISRIQDRLSLISQSHKLVSQNLANATTPGYQAKDISFKGLLQESMRDQGLHLMRSDQRHIGQEVSTSAAVGAEVEEVGPVNLEQEMLKLTRNSVEYQYMVNLLNKKFASLKHVISEGVS